MQNIIQRIQEKIKVEESKKKVFFYKSMLNCLNSTPKIFELLISSMGEEASFTTLTKTTQNYMMGDFYDDGWYITAAMSDLSTNIYELYRFDNYDQVKLENLHKKELNDWGELLVDLLSSPKGIPYQKNITNIIWEVSRFIPEKLYPILEGSNLIKIWEMLSNSINPYYLEYDKYKDYLQSPTNNFSIYDLSRYFLENNLDKIYQNYCISTFFD